MIKESFLMVTSVLCGQYLNATYKVITSLQNVRLISFGEVSFTLIVVSSLPFSVSSGLRSVILKSSVKLYAGNCTPRSSADKTSMIKIFT